MDTIFLNSGNSKTSHSHRLLLNLTNEINLNKSDKYVALNWMKMVKMCLIQKILK